MAFNKASAAIINLSNGHFSISKFLPQPLHTEILREALHHINPSAHKTAIDEAITKISTFETGTLLQKNATFSDYLQNGVEVNYYDEIGRAHV